MPFQKGNPYIFKKGHNIGHKINVGRKHSEETKEKHRLLMMNERSPTWKGDDVGYYALHQWVRTRLQEPDSCPSCGRKKKLDLSNITGVYNRALINWAYLCKGCHQRYDYSKGLRKRSEKWRRNHSIMMLGNQYARKTKT